jgi:hypothetical protein
VKPSRASEGRAYQFLDERDERLEVLFEREVELVALLEIDRDCAKSVS